MSLESVEILLVEDNDDDALMIQEAFSEANVVNHIHRVKDGEEAMAYLRKQGQYKTADLPGLVLLDISMPKKDGFQVLQEIKSDPQLKQLPIIMLTTSSREEDIVRSYSQGACSYVTKPVGFQKFTEVVRQFHLYWTLVSKLPGPRR